MRWWSQSSSWRSASSSRAAAAFSDDLDPSPGIMSHSFSVVLVSKQSCQVLHQWRFWSHMTCFRSIKYFWMSFSLKMIDSVHYILLNKASFQNAYCEGRQCLMLTVHCRVLAPVGLAWSLSPRISLSLMMDCQLCVSSITTLYPQTVQSLLHLPLKYTK